MKGGKNKQPLGYTIVEVMVVLAVSGVMFLIAAQFINGKQQRAAFTSGVNDMASQIQDVIEQVTDGKYSDIPLNCSLTTPTTIGFSVGTQTQGTHAACAFVGKFLHFNVNGDKTLYEVFSLAAPSAATDLNGVKPIDGGSYSLTVQATTPQSLDVKKVTINGTTQVYGFGFTQSQGSVISTGTTTTGYSSGGQTINLVYGNISPTASESTAATSITGNGSSPAPLIAAKSVSVCMTDGSRYAQILLGGSDTNGSQQSQLTASVQQLGTTPC